MNKLKFARSIVLNLFWMFAIPGSAQTQEVFIEGVIRERRDMNRPGQSVVISPSGETRFDTQNYFKSDPSLQLSGSGRSAGFSLPLFRGQDARSSHVFVDDIELQDPYSGLPMIDDLDLRAFGSMTIHKGVSPWNMPVLEPGGVVQFTMRRHFSPLEAGVTYGDVAGASGWIKSGKSFENDLNAGLYGRVVQSSGQYKYYSDNNTILNPKDDAVIRRRNNDLTAFQGLGHASWIRSDLTARALIWGQQSDRGIPLGETSGDGRARANAQTSVLSTAMRSDWTDHVWTGVDVGGFAATRAFKDPDLDIGFASNRKLKSQSIRSRLTGGYDSSQVSVIATAERQVSKTTLSSSYDGDYYSPSAAGYKLFFGARAKFLDHETIEFKIGSQWLSSITSTNLGQKSDTTTERGSPSGSIAWSHFLNDLLLYGQLAKSSRSPSLLERIGDGAQIEGAPALSPEESVAAELGVRQILTYSERIRALLSFTLWARNNREVIRIKQVSPVRWRAHNLGSQKFRGAEVRSDIGADDAGVEFALSWMHAGQANGRTLVPMTPMWQSAVGTRLQIIDRLIFRTMSQYIGRMYHDVSNTRELMWTLTHDVSLDYSSASGHWKLGTSVTNITNVMSNTIKDTISSREDGRIALSHFNGEPLPGRAWLISLSASI